NLIINADHALGKEGRLAVSARAGFGAKTLVVEIDDTGCGISEENLGKIFDPFFTTKEKGKGTGLGLFTSRSIIECMSGDIQVRSQQDKGTCFTITLPVDQEVKEPGQRVPTQTRNSKEPACILVVDDDAMIREILTEALTASRYRTDVAADGLQAMQKLQSGKYDCILLDLRLPNRSGVEVMQWLQSDARKQTAPPVIAVTGLADVDETEAALRLGALACVKKPFSIETVLSEIESALARVFVDSNY
ncbi:MAG: response regulator, partial [Candidatus Sumerlaeota bacterium]|nr:response regulator [Candidatus Sumerlaeota bacterium]